MLFITHAIGLGGTAWLILFPPAGLFDGPPESESGTPDIDWSRRQP